MHPITDRRDCRSMWRLAALPFHCGDIYFWFFFIFIFKQKSENGSGEMGAKVDPAVSSGCCGAPSPTRLRPSPLPRSLSLSFSAGRGEMICGSEEGRNNGSRCVQEITELPLWPKNCVSRRPLWFFSPSSQDFAPLLRTLGDSSESVFWVGSFPLFVSFLFFFFFFWCACCFCRLKIDPNSRNCTAWAVNPHVYVCVCVNVQH